MTRRWTTPEQIRERVQRRWRDGTLLQAYAAGADFPVIDMALRGPKPAEIGPDLAAVQEWVRGLETGQREHSRYTLRLAPVGGRLIGRNELPARAVISTYAQAWALLGVGGQVRRFEEILTLTRDTAEAGAWVRRHPLKAIELGEKWPRILAAYTWLDSARDSGQFLRQISAPGVDTKFVEGHRSVLAAMLGVSGSAHRFVDDLGLRAKPAMVRLRFDPSRGLVGGLSEITARIEEIATLDLRVSCAVIVENEITFLSLPVPEGGVILWGHGFVDSRLSTLPWLADTDIHYWGDLDTNGFAILNQVRARFPRTRSFLMDRQTLLTHQDRWVREPTPKSARLEHLTDDETTLYEALLQDHHGIQVRLEQERIDWGWACERLPYPATSPA